MSNLAEAPVFSNDVTVVIPVHNGARFFSRVLPALQASNYRPRIVIVDDASTDDTVDVARSYGVEVISLPEKVGPAQARNLGAQAVDSEVVLFMDADCVPHPDVVDRVADAFRKDPELVSLTGSYDTKPEAGGFFSQYMNLRHHVVHQKAEQEQSTFWSGCGAVRRSAFLEIGGFDHKRYPKPQIEDIELGQRLRQLGRTRLSPDVQVTHLKGWTLFSIVKTEILDRGIPWAKLILQSGGLPNDLNLRRSQRLAAAIAPISLLALLATPWAILTGHWAILGLCAIAVATSVALNVELLRAFARLRGPAFAAGAGVFHQLHLSYSAATFALCVLAWSNRYRPGAINPRGRSAADRLRLEQMLRAAFARYDPIAMGVAVGGVAALSLFGATAVLLLKGGAVVGPNLSLLGNYLLGFEMSWPGAFIGFVEAAAGGFVFGFALATTMNLVIRWYENGVRSQLQRLAERTPLAGDRP